MESALCFQLLDIKVFVKRIHVNFFLFDNLVEVNTSEYNLVWDILVLRTYLSVGNMVQERLSENVYYAKMV